MIFNTSIAVCVIFQGRQSFREIDYNHVIHKRKYLKHTRTTSASVLYIVVENCTFLN